MELAKLVEIVDLPQHRAIDDLDAVINLAGVKRGVSVLGPDIEVKADDFVDDVLGRYGGPKDDRVLAAVVGDDVQPIATIIAKGIVAGGGVDDVVALAADDDIAPGLGGRTRTRDGVGAVIAENQV